MPRKSNDPANDPIGQEFMEALQRMANSAPLHLPFQKLAKLGRLRINYSTVAKEAGRSRTLIGMENCRYPAVRAAVKAAMKPKVATQTADDVIRRLREENAALRLDVKRAHSLSLAMLRRCEETPGPTADIIPFDRSKD